mmetsp:Transcript_20165/g.45862  ORF Transcript_20165/g.45862 Transcript_20165/m.45862 type:complete len:81 (-) Transcript_20165:113-355(-)
MQRSLPQEEAAAGWPCGSVWCDREMRNVFKLYTDKTGCDDLHMKLLGLRDDKVLPPRACRLPPVDDSTANVSLYQDHVFR